MTARCASCNYPLSVSDSVSCFECFSHFHIDCAHLVGFPYYEFSTDPVRNTFLCTTCRLLPIPGRSQDPQCAADSYSDSEDMPSRQLDYHSLEPPGDLARDMHELKGNVQDLSDLCKDMMREINELKSINLTLRCCVENLRHDNEDRDKAIDDLCKRIDALEGKKGTLNPNCLNNDRFIGNVDLENDSSSVLQIDEEEVNVLSFEHGDETSIKRHKRHIEFTEVTKSSPEYGNSNEVDSSETGQNITYENDIPKNSSNCIVLRPEESKEKRKDWDWRGRRTVELNSSREESEVDECETDESDIEEVEKAWEALHQEVELQNQTITSSYVTLSVVNKEEFLDRSKVNSETDEESEERSVDCSEEDKLESEKITKGEEEIYLDKVKNKSVSTTKEESASSFEIITSEEDVSLDEQKLKSSLNEQKNNDVCEIYSKTDLETEENPIQDWSEDSKIILGITNDVVTESYEEKGKSYQSFAEKEEEIHVEEEENLSDSISEREDEADDQSVNTLLEDLDKADALDEEDEDSVEDNERFLEGEESETLTNKEKCFDVPVAEEEINASVAQSDEKELTRSSSLRSLLLDDLVEVQVGKIDEEEESQDEDVLENVLEEERDTDDEHNEDLLVHGEEENERGREDHVVDEHLENNIDQDREEHLEGEEVCQDVEGSRLEGEDVCQDVGESRLEGEPRLEGVAEEDDEAKGEQRLGGQSPDLAGEVQPTEPSQSKSPQHTEEDLWHYLKESVSMEHPHTVEEFLHSLIGTLQHVPEDLLQPVIVENIKRANSPCSQTDEEHHSSSTKLHQEVESAAPLEGASKTEGGLEALQDEDGVTEEESSAQQSSGVLEDETSRDAEGYSIVEGALIGGFWIFWLSCGYWGT